VAAKEMIHDTVERSDLTHAEKAAVLGENAKRFLSSKNSGSSRSKLIQEGREGNPPGVRLLLR
jgi:hypothetical protein